MQSVNHMVEEMYLNQVQGVSAVKDAKIDLSNMGTALRNAALASDSATADSAAAEWETSEAIMKEKLARLESLMTTAEGKDALAKVNETWQNTRFLHEILLNMAKISSVRQKVEMLPEIRTQIEEIQKGDTAMVSAMDALVRQMQSQVDKAYERSREEYEVARIQTLAIVVLALLVCVAIAFLLSRSIITELTRIEKVAVRLAEGDVEQDLEAHATSGDEIGRVVHAFRQVIGYMRDMATAAEAISNGNLSLQISPRSPRDALGKAFDRMSTNLGAMVASVSSAADALADASQQLSESSEQAGVAAEQIATTVRQVAQGNQEQSAAAQETSASVGQLSRAIDQIASGARHQAASIEKASVSVDRLNESISQVAAATQSVSSATREVEQTASKGADVVRRSIRGMATIRERTDSAAAEVQDLTKYSEQIESIVEAIDDIAEQTNLLALNAAIEAARAGEHGRGFAVVADEVRKLAERASRSTKEIAALISQLRREIDEAATAMEHGALEVETGSKLAEEADEALKGILRSVQGAANHVAQIASAVGQMESASQEVVGLMHSVSAVVEEFSTATAQMAASSSRVSMAIEKIAAVSEETTASAEEVSASTEEVSSQVSEMVSQSRQLARMADELQAAVARFDLGEEPKTIMRRRKDDWGEARLAAQPAGTPRSHHL